MKLRGNPDVVSLFNGKSIPLLMSTLNLQLKLINGSEAGRAWNISSYSSGFSSFIGKICSPTNFKFTMNRPTVTYRSFFLVNLRCYLTPLPLISVRALVKGPKGRVHSPNNLACP